MATPARADTGAGAPKLLRKEPLCPSASAKSTPVKSPEKKRTKTDDAGDEQPPLVQKSLMVELEKAAAEPADSVSWIYMEFSKRVAQIYSKLIRRSPSNMALRRSTQAAVKAETTSPSHSAAPGTCQTVA